MEVLGVALFCRVMNTHAGDCITGCFNFPPTLVWLI